jgi:hypothetical protein
MDMELLDAERRFILSDDLMEVFPKDYNLDLNLTISNLRDKLLSGSTCYFMRENLYVYLTFAGLEMNSLIAAFFKVDSQQSSDLCLISDAPIDFYKLPETLSGFGSLLGLINTGEKRSIFQDLLPAELILRERESAWLAKPLAETNLQRLRACGTELISWTSSFNLI